MKQTILIPVFILIAILTLSCGSDDGDSVSFEEQLAIDEAIIDNYLDENGIGADIHESGIRYVIDEEGTGDKPEVGDVIAVKYTLFNLDGDTLGMDTIGFTLQLNQQIISAWRLMVPEMNEGGRITIYAPSGYCFGTNGGGAISPNEILIFEIELLAVIDNAEEQLSVEELIIDEFLGESGIDAETHESGIRFVTLTEGTGDSPTSDDNVFVKYKGTLLAGQTFDSNNTGVQFSLQNLIEAWKIMIPTMKEGGKIRIYAPSKYCYGPNGNQAIPGNTTLVFEIELIEIR